PLAHERGADPAHDTVVVPEARVVARGLVLATRITEPDQQSNGRGHVSLPRSQEKAGALITKKGERSRSGRSVAADCEKARGCCHRGPAAVAPLSRLTSSFRPCRLPSFPVPWRLRPAWPLQRRPQPARLRRPPPAFPRFRRPHAAPPPPRSRDRSCRAIPPSRPEEE